MTEEKRPEPITVAELIQKLSEFPDDLPVLIRGYEGGYQFPAPLYVTNLAHKGYIPTYTGEYDDWWEFDEEAPFAALVIPR